MKESSLHPRFCRSKCMIELNVFSLEEMKLLHQQEKQKQNQHKSMFDEEGYDPHNISQIQKQNQGNSEDKNRWEVLSRELGQKQELIHRMIKEIDEATQQIQKTGTEIIDLRQDVKFLSSENAILKKRLTHEEEIEVMAQIRPEIRQMSAEELKAKIIKVAQTYREQRLQNEEFDKALKQAQRDIAEARKAQEELEVLEMKHQENNQKLLKLQSEVGKIELYKETISKQEKVIAKLEKLMEGSFADNQKAKDAMEQAENIKKQNISLMEQLKDLTYGPNREFSQLEKYKYECTKLERIVVDLQKEPNQKKPYAQFDNDDSLEHVQLQVQLERILARCDSLETEMTENVRTYAREIAMYQSKMMEKQALIQSLNIQQY
eukprot:TRINITY_DN12445_c0_g1_i3.p1 TRINITY_DN12445_c0_g1~~TRINITY_DN12445_c0_g1_i3.p1  ORF type:complete len:377 (-),score=91.06 TRINITY_DN12445_c0_g1_i3:3-1133(-)